VNPRDKLKELDDILDSDPYMLKAQELVTLLRDAVNLAKSLADEVDSVWSMIDEQKASDIENHKKLVRQELDRKINETLMLASSKIIKA
jgi:hypothetical protein